MSQDRAPLRLLVSLLSLALGLQACNENVLIRPGHTDVRFQSPPTEVDILLVVDDSCSMEDEQTKLSEGFSEFVEFFDVADVDYHIGITTTDMDDPDKRGRLIGDVQVITRDTDNADDVFKDNVKVGIEGSGNERGLDAAARALGETMTTGANAGFLRPEALLSVIFVSDEEDTSHYGVNDYINFFRDLNGQRRRDSFNASALIGVDSDSLEPSDCGINPLNPNAGARASQRYWDIAAQTGGVVASICEDEFAEVVNRMGLASSRLLDTFPLERRPDPPSLAVTLFMDEDDSEGVALELDDEESPYPWVYEEDLDSFTYQIRFTDLTRLPPIGSRVVIRYELL
jgi:hypothetical protein